MAHQVDPDPLPTFPSTFLNLRHLDGWGPEPREWPTLLFLGQTWPISCGKQQGPCQSPAAPGELRTMDASVLAVSTASPRATSLTLKSLFIEASWMLSYPHWWGLGCGSQTQLDFYATWAQQLTAFPMPLSSRKIVLLRNPQLIFARQIIRWEEH